MVVGLIELHNKSSKLVVGLIEQQRYAKVQKLVVGLIEQHCISSKLVVGLIEAPSSEKCSLVAAAAEKVLPTLSKVSNLQGTVDVISSLV